MTEGYELGWAVSVGVAVALGTTDRFGRLLGGMLFVGVFVPVGVLLGSKDIDGPRLGVGMPVLVG